MCVFYVTDGNPRGVNRRTQLDSEFPELDNTILIHNPSCVLRSPLWGHPVVFITFLFLVFLFNFLKEKMFDNCFCSLFLIFRKTTESSFFFFSFFFSSDFSNWYKYFHFGGAWFEAEINKVGDRKAFLCSPVIESLVKVLSGIYLPIPMVMTAKVADLGFSRNEWLKLRWYYYH